ncbi:MAG TPA: NAD(P)/FAD-dependent oxidoreductase [Cyclobacteriaceae bacterium]|nr:NAD(P)/FAD-dependent oxidoreductase [Cyclobacteriaceae bacterium]
MKTNTDQRKHVVVIGGGFAGLNFIKRLQNNKYYRVTLVDRNNYNYFTPLLYQVATSFLEPSSISYPFRKFLRNTGIAFHNAALTRVDTLHNRAYLSNGEELDYDILVFAAGVKTNFFGNETIRKNAFSLKGIDDALYMRNEMIKRLEAAAIEDDPVVRQKLLTVVIAGGGATGVELAGMFAEMKSHVVHTDYPELRNEPIDIHLIDGLPNLLAAMSEKTHEDAYRVLSKMGVFIHLNATVTSYENDLVYLSNDIEIPSMNLIWCAGVTANTFEGISLESLGKGKRMVTDQYHKVQGYENIYAIGDISIQFQDEKYPNGHPQVAQPAIQQGTALAKNLVLQAKGRPMKPFVYFDRGDMAIVGRSFAVADLFKHKVHLGGLLGLLAWLFIHLVSLVNYNNKIKTFYNWLVAYLTRDQALRMIFNSDARENKQEKPKITHRVFAEQD